MLNRPPNCNYDAAVPPEADAQTRVMAFAFLGEQTASRGERVLPRRLLEDGIEVRGTRVPLIGPQGIFKPAICEFPISVTTVPEVAGRPRPYEDEPTYEGVRYRYRGTDPNHRDNVGLREAMRRRVPLIYFHGHRPGWYHAEWPVYVVGDDPKTLTFTLVAEEPISLTAPAVAEPLSRAYLARVMQQRLHQSAFRDLVLSAYEERCAICRLRHRELLEAAHILPDSHPMGEPVVSNGLSLCKLHHAAFDAYMIGIRPQDLVVEVRADIRKETDGPTLRHALQGIDHQPLTVPRRHDQRPKREFLAERYQRFLQAS